MANIRSVMLAVLIVASLFVFSACSNQQAQGTDVNAPAYQASVPDNNVPQAASDNVPQVAPDNNVPPVNPDNAPGGPPRRGGGQFGNMTAEQRQQMINTMMQQQTAACQDKSEGDACVMQGSRGGQNGTCKTYNETLRCSFQGGQGNFSRGSFGQGSGRQRYQPPATS